MEQRVIVITGPTASGKSALALALEFLVQLAARLGALAAPILQAAVVLGLALLGLGLLGCSGTGYGGDLVAAALDHRQHRPVQQPVQQPHQHQKVDDLEAEGQPAEFHAGLISL